ncbi:unnamed protein product [Orchesella dallaii]|uniref:Uncharacterized protein n=1 Tax=Orchesella dallaii TaxID=48710 RepID=A0ABP1S229_9HEXA
MDIQAIMTKHWNTDSEVENYIHQSQNSRPTRKKKFRKRVRYRKDCSSSSCSCSSCSSSDISNCSCGCCCSCSSLSCSSDSDERFAKYYELSSDEAELRHLDFPAESRKDRRNMVKLLLHTLVMWDDIWKTGSPEEDSDASESDRPKGTGVNETSDSSESETSEDEQQDGRFLHKNDTRIRMMSKRRGPESKRKLDVAEQEELAEKGRLKQAMEMTDDCGVFFSGKWYGQPLEEVDPFIYDDTFCVLGWRQQNRCIVYRYYKGNSVGYFAPDHPVRLFCFSLITHRYFWGFIMFTILANCVTLALERFKYDKYGSRVHENILQTTLEILEYVKLNYSKKQFKFKFNEKLF